MKSAVRLEIVSLEKTIFSDFTTMVIVTGIVGELGILPGHTPLLTKIKPGQIRVTLSSGVQEIYYVSGGILDVQPDVITILADTVIRADDLDEAEAIKARENARRLLEDKKSKVDFTDALIQITQAVAKLQAIKLLQNSKNKR